MADDRLGIVKLQDDAEGELFAIVLVSGSVRRRDYTMNSSAHALTERRVREALAKAGISTIAVASLLQRARDDFHRAASYTVH